MNQQIENNFKSHDVSTEQAQNMEHIRQEVKALAYTIEALVPQGREKSLALTKLEEAMFWANAGIARYI